MYEIESFLLQAKTICGYLGACRQYEYDYMEALTAADAPVGRDLASTWDSLTCPWAIDGIAQLMTLSISDIVTFLKVSCHLVIENSLKIFRLQAYILPQEKIKSIVCFDARYCKG